MTAKRIISNEFGTYSNLLSIAYIYIIKKRKKIT